MSEEEEAAFERARIAIQIQDLVRLLGKDCPKDQQIAVLALAEASIAVALRGAGEVPRAAVEAAVEWWKKRTDPATRKRSRAVWDAVVKAIVAGAPRTQDSNNGPGAFELAAQELHMSIGTVKREFYAVMVHRKATGGWVPEESSGPDTTTARR